MNNLKFYQISANYINFLSFYAPHLFHNRNSSQKYDRKYIGIILNINNMDYFAPLSSFKIKHNKMKEKLDFIKIKNYAVINLNCMFPVPATEYKYVDFSQEKDISYQKLLLAEYRYVKSIQNKIKTNAKSLYKLKTKGSETPLTKRCNDFLLLEKMCNKYTL